MKLEKILDNLEVSEKKQKNPFIKIIGEIIRNKPKNSKEIKKITPDSETSRLNKLDNIVISKIFGLIENEFSQKIKTEFVKISSQLDILTDIIVRDGNCIMKEYWFEKLYKKEIKNINTKRKELQKNIEDPKSEITDSRKRDYKIYKSCVHTAFHNYIENNREAKITDNELSILLTLSKQLGLSQEEVKLIKYLIFPATKAEISSLIDELEELGVIFCSKKTRTIYIADEVVRVLRKIRGKEVADKFFRRILRLFSKPQIKLICKNHNIDHKLSFEKKIKEIINEGISFTDVLINDVHEDGTNLSDKKKFLNELWGENFKLSPALKGATLEDKVENILSYFEAIEKDEKVGISVDGYEKLLTELGKTLPKLNAQVKSEFEIQEEKALKSELLLDYNIKPRDILDLIHLSDRKAFIKAREIKTRGNDIENILDAYKDAKNLHLENYVKIGFRDLKSLKKNGIIIKEADLGIKFEELTKNIFSQLGFNVDEKLKKELNTQKHKIDILLNLGNHELFIVECKTVKESVYNKFSSISGQVGAYLKLAEETGYHVSRILIVAPEFSKGFVTDCESCSDLNLSLLTASSLKNILEVFKKSQKNKQFPSNLLMRDVLIQEDKIIKSIQK